MPSPERVRVASCHLSEATVIRAALSAHGIESHVSGEAASALGPAVTGFITHHVWVGADDAEQAARLIDELRRGGEHELAEGEAIAGDLDVEDDAPAGLVVSPAGDVAEVLDRRKRTGAAVVLALVVTFGTAHMYTRAWMRGVALAAVEFVGIRHAMADNRIGVAMIAGAILFDLVGALVRIRRRRPPTALPAAVAKPSRTTGSRS